MNKKQMYITPKVESVVISLEDGVLNHMSDVSSSNRTSVEEADYRDSGLSWE